MANSEYNYIPTYIRRIINNRPKDVVTAKYWNELFNLLITQGDHTAEELGNILNYFSTRLVGVESEIAESAEAIANIRGVFRINVTYSNGVYSADKTFTEIKEAYDAGRLPYVVLTDGTLDFVYTLAYFSVPDGTGQDFVDFARYRIEEDTLETEMLRVYSYTMDSGSNVVKRIDEFKMPTSLKNPNALTFTGGATDSYDGSEPKTVDIPVIPYKVINKNTAARHSHDNKTVLDGITAEKVTEWDSKNSITDSGGYFTSDTVEGALQEIGAELAGINTLLGSGIQISFTISAGDVETFSVVSGTTWAEWIGTGRLIFNDGLVLYIYGGVVATEAGVYALSLDGSTAVSGSDTIVSGATYTIINWGG